MKVAVFGLGYVGLPLAILCAKSGHTVIGIDTNPGIVKATNSRHSHIQNQSLESALSKLKGNLRASTESADAAGADIAIVCVPTPVDGQKRPDLKAVRSASEAVAKNLRKGQLVIIESTVYPGTLEEIVKPILESSGLKAGKDFCLAHCPERIDPGNEKWPLEKIPRVLGALTPEGAEKAKAFYESILEAKVTVLNSIKAAEAVKVTENTFRDINIAFVNELAMSFDKLGIDVLEVIRGASTKPFGYMPFFPGPGVGGHCIAVDPYYLIEKAREMGFEHKFLPLARQINDSMPAYVKGKVVGILKAIGKPVAGSKVAVLGLAYKAEVDDTRESPALKIAEALRKEGMCVSTFDPHVLRMSSAASLDEAAKDACCIVLATAHKALVSSLTSGFLKKNNVLGIVDARNALDAESIKSAGIRYAGIGR